MDIFLTGASGYIGGVVAKHLTRHGHSVRGLTRTPSAVEALAVAGIDPVLGELDDAPLLAREAKRADAVVNTADSDHRGAVETFILLPVPESNEAKRRISSFVDKAFNN